MAARTTSIAVGHKVSTDELRQRGADRALDEYYKVGIFSCFEKVVFDLKPHARACGYILIGA